MTLPLPVLLDVDTGGRRRFGAVASDGVSGPGCTRHHLRGRQLPSESGCHQYAHASGCYRGAPGPCLPRGWTGRCSMAACRRQLCTAVMAWAISACRRRAATRSISMRSNSCGGTLADATEPLTLICLAPLSNIAMLMRMYPVIRDKIARLYVMGGKYASAGQCDAGGRIQHTLRSGGSRHRTSQWAACYFVSLGSLHAGVVHAE